MRTGRLIVFKGPGQSFEMQERVVRPLKAGEILVKNLYTTICGSDLHTFRGLRKEPSPTVLGHEIVGKIEEIDPHHSGLDFEESQLNPGDLITWSIFSS